MGTCPQFRHTVATQQCVACLSCTPNRRGKETGAFGNRQAKNRSSWHAKKSFRHLNMESSSTLYTLMPYTSSLMLWGGNRRGVGNKGEFAQDNRTPPHIVRGPCVVSGCLSELNPRQQHDRRDSWVSDREILWSEHVTRASSITSWERPFKGRHFFAETWWCRFNGLPFFSPVPSQTAASQPL